MAFNSQGYKDAIQKELAIVNKDKVEVPFMLNPAQDHFVGQMETYLLIVILKARKMGFSSVALAIAVLKFIFGENERCVSMSFDADAAGKQLERVKYFLRSFERTNNIKIPLKYNSKKELVYEKKDENGNIVCVNTLRIGTAKSGSFGRGDDITFLHLTEVAFCPSMEDLLSGVGEACVNNAHKIFETTANGYNDFKEFWDRAKLGLNGYKALFYGPHWEYDEIFLAGKLQTLGERLFKQEYPKTEEEAFLTSGACYFDILVISEMLKKAKEPIINQFS
ncbi:MAG: hypothetical protein WC823_00160 [Parcubacteria group bacterium]|jgi:hypothetical protein